MTSNELTIWHAQHYQPWTVPYSLDLFDAAQTKLPHLLGSHAVLHAAKSVGKLATVFESLDHRNGSITDDERKQLAAMSADLLTVALRLANLYGFELSEVLCDRVREKNGVDILTEGS